MKRSLLPMIPLLIGLALLLPGALTAQNESDTPAVEKEQDPRGPLPFYYGKLGLDDEQKTKLYTIQEDYEARIEAIRKQIAQLRGEQDAKMQMLLTPGQKLRLKELREAAAKKKAEAEAKAADEATRPADDS